MSYILDALKKSEKERRQVKERNDTSAHESVILEKKKRPLWPYFLGAALLLNASVSVLWFGPWHTKESRAVRETDGRQMNEAQMGDMSSGLPESRIEDKKIIDSGELTKSKSLPDTMPSKEKRMKQTTTGVKEGASPDIEQTSVAHNAPSEPAHDVDIPPPDKDRLYSLNDLPSLVKQHLPEFSVSVFLYSDDPPSRMARINGQLLKEGQYLTEGVKLEEIVPDGVIFNYRAYRFHVRLK